MILPILLRRIGKARDDTTSEDLSQGTETRVCSSIYAAERRRWQQRLIGGTDPCITSWKTLQTRSSEFPHGCVRAFERGCRGKLLAENRAGVAAPATRGGISAEYLSRCSSRCVSWVLSCRNWWMIRSDVMRPCLFG